MAEVRLGKTPQTHASIEIKTITNASDMQQAPMGQRLFHAFFMVDSPKQMMDNLLFKVFVPSIKQLFENMFNRGIHMLFFGEDPVSPVTQNTNGQSFVSYGSFFSGSGGSQKTAAQALQVSTYMDFDMPIITPTPTEPDAEATANRVLQQLREILALRAPDGHVTIAELYQSVGRSGEWTDEYYGWKDLSQAKVVPVGGGRYMVQMPKAVIIR